MSEKKVKKNKKNIWKLIKLFLVLYCTSERFWKAGQKTKGYVMCTRLEFLVSKLQDVLSENDISMSYEESDYSSLNGDVNKRIATMLRCGLITFTQEQLVPAGTTVTYVPDNENIQMALLDNPVLTTDLSAKGTLKLFEGLTDYQFDTIIHLL